MSAPNTINDGGPAFPVPDSHHASGQVQYGFNGMSLRAYFAGQALNGMLSNSNLKAVSNVVIAECATEYADAMIAELNKSHV